MNQQCSDKQFLLFPFSSRMDASLKAVKHGPDSLWYHFDVEQRWQTSICSQLAYWYLNLSFCSRHKEICIICVYRNAARLLFEYSTYLKFYYTSSLVMTTETDFIFSMRNLKITLPFRLRVGVAPLNVNLTFTSPFAIPRMIPPKFSEPFLQSLDYVSPTLKWITVKIPTIIIL